MAGWVVVALAYGGRDKTLSDVTALLEAGAYPNEPVPSPGRCPAGACGEAGRASGSMYHAFGRCTAARGRVRNRARTSPARRAAHRVNPSSCRRAQTR